jgi:hypothetical protein
MRLIFVLLFVLFYRTTNLLAQSPGDRNLNQAVNQQYPADAFYSATNPNSRIYNLKTNFGAVGDGQADDTQAFIDAYNFILSQIDSGTGGWGTDGAIPQDNTRSYVIYIPNGTYKVTNTLIYSGAVRTQPGQSTNEQLAWIRFIGENRSNTVIKLSDNNPLFAVLSFGKLAFNNSVARNTLRNLTVDTGSGNPGAIGIDFAGANNASIVNLKVRSSDPQKVGLTGLNLSIGTVAGYYRDITIDGFNNGIRLDPYHFTAISGEFITLTDQKVSGIRFGDGGGSFRKILSNNTVPAVLLAESACHAVIIESAFDSPPRPQARPFRSLTATCLPAIFR